MLPATSTHSRGTASPFLARLPLTMFPCLWILGYATSLVLVALVSEQHGRRMAQEIASARHSRSGSPDTAVRRRGYRLASAEQAMACSDRVCTAVADPGAWSSMDVSFVRGRRSGGSPLQVWQVNCTGDDERPVVTLMWDARTGELRSASRVSDSHSRVEAPPLTAAQAEFQARHWLAGLIESDPPRIWQPPASPHRSPGHWDFTFRYWNREALVEIHELTGALLLFRQRPISAPGQIP